MSNIRIALERLHQAAEQYLDTGHRDAQREAELRRNPAESSTDAALVLHENYPGQHSTPDDCPVCHGPIDIDQVMVDGFRGVYQEGRWSCLRGCDPRTLALPYRDREGYREEWRP